MNVPTRVIALSLIMLSSIQCRNYYEDNLAPLDISIENINIKKVKKYGLENNYLTFTFIVDNIYDDTLNLRGIADNNGFHLLGGPLTLQVLDGNIDIPDIAYTGYMYNFDVNIPPGKRFEMECEYFIRYADNGKVELLLGSWFERRIHKHFSFIVKEKIQNKNLVYSKRNSRYIIDESQK